MHYQIKDLPDVAALVHLRQQQQLALADHDLHPVELVEPVPPPAVARLRINDCITMANYEKLVECVHKVNSRHSIDADLVLVILVHKRAHYLKHVLESMARQPNIDKMTLVVSHDGHFEEVVELVRSVTFCRVV